MYNYDSSIDPPAALLPIKVTNPETGVSDNQQAKIDTGAAMSVLPEALVDLLALEPMGDVLAAGYDGKTALLPTYDVSLGIESYAIRDVEVTVSPRRDVLLGRDVLNHFILTLDGKNLTFDLEDP